MFLWTLRVRRKSLTGKIGFLQCGWKSIRGIKLAMDTGNFELVERMPVPSPWGSNLQKEPMRIWTQKS